MLSEIEFKEATSALKSATFHISDFEATIKAHLKPKAFFFLDPPYAIKRRKPFTEYDSAIFSQADLQRLLECLE
ncbi:hypothetical protein CJI59_37560, partial [Streptomyces sp. Alain-F2R5]